MTERAAILERLRRKVRAGEPILGGGAGSGLSAKAQETGGIDLLIIYNSGRFRMAGRGSLAGLLAYGNANEMVQQMAVEIVTAVKHTPVLAGVNGTDPFLQPGRLLSTLRELGLSGVQNFPTVGLIDGQFRRDLEETGMGYDREVELIRSAHAADLLTTPYVFSEADAIAMAGAGADVLVCHVGLTSGGTIGANTTRSLDGCAEDINAWAAAARQVRDDIIVLCHGGPIAQPADAQYVLTRTKGVHGFYGASSMERLPVEQAIAEQVRSFARHLSAAIEPVDPSPERKPNG
jgi:predicted TIM-barrel enzyme